MRASSAILFPWQSTYARLELSRRWWHRLSVVIFFVALVPALVAFSAAGYAGFQPVHSYMPVISEWVRDNSGNPSRLVDAAELNGADTDDGLGNNYRGSPILKVPPDKDGYMPINEQVAMPDGTPGEFIGTSEENIKIIWDKALARAIRKQWVFSTTAGIALTLVFSYLLQSLYRTLLYVVYGSQTSKGLMHSSGQTSAASLDVALTHATPGRRQTWVP